MQLAKAKTPEDRAKVDLKLHFMKKTLDEPVRAPILPRYSSTLFTTSGRRACLMHHAFFLLLLLLGCHYDWVSCAVPPFWVC